MEQKDGKKLKESIWKAPQFCVAIFVIISAYTTGQGMTETFFDGNFICGAGISVGIQLLLVWLGWRVPKLFSMGGHAARIFLVLTYTLTIMWSTGFSFVYVCNHIYSSFYMRDDQNLLADTYRKNMADLERWAEKDFNQYLDAVIEGIGSLQEKAGDIDNGAREMENETIPDYPLLREYFADYAEVRDMISQCEDISDGKSIGNLDKMRKVIGDAHDEITDANASVQNEIEQKEEAVRSAAAMIVDYSQKKYGYKAGTTADGELNVLIETEKARKEQLEAEVAVLKEKKEKGARVFKAVEAWSSYVSSKENSVEGVLTAKFAQILAELGSTSPQMDQVNSLSDEIYAELTTALQTDGSNTAYSELLKDYLSLKESLKTLENIRAVQSFCYEEDRAAITGSTELLVSPSPSAEVSEAWMELWNAKFIEIKSNYYRLASSSEQEVVQACEHISWLQRSLLTDLNGIERAIYYLFSAHAQLAWFSFLLALFLDLVPILLMIIKVLLEKTSSEIHSVVFAAIP